MKAQEFPQNLMEFEEQFQTEEACWKYLRSRKWPEGFRCSRREARDSWLAGRRVEECRKYGHQESVTAGTMFHGTK